MNVDLRVYVITTTLPHLGRAHFAIAEAAVRGGATVLQFRDKTMPDAEFASTASRILSIARKSGVPLIVNDRVEIAAAIGADGVHVGRTDAAVRDIRRSLPPGMIVGASATCYDEAIAACDAGADYLGVGPIFSTASKADATPPLGHHWRHQCWQLEKHCGSGCGRGGGDRRGRRSCRDDSRNCGTQNRVGRVVCDSRQRKILIRGTGVRL